MDESVTISLERYHDLIDAVQYYSDFHKKFIKTLEILDNSTEILHINVNKSLILSLIESMKNGELLGKDNINISKYKKSIKFKDWNLWGIWAGKVGFQKKYQK